MNPKSKIPGPMKQPILLYLTTLALTALCGGAAIKLKDNLRKIAPTNFGREIPFCAFLLSF